MSRKDEKFEEKVNRLLTKLYDDYQSSIPQEQRKYSGIPAEPLIWNLFYGKNYHFSSRMFKEILKRIKEDIAIENTIDC